MAHSLTANASSPSASRAGSTSSSQITYLCVSVVSSNIIFSLFIRYFESTSLAKTAKVLFTTKSPLVSSRRKPSVPIDADGVNNAYHLCTTSAIFERDIEISHCNGGLGMLSSRPDRFSTPPIVGLGLLLPVEYGRKALVEAFPLELHVQTCQFKPCQQCVNPSPSLLDSYSISNNRRRHLSFMSYSDSTDIPPSSLTASASSYPPPHIPSVLEITQQQHALGQMMYYDYGASSHSSPRHGNSMFIAAGKRDSLGAGVLDGSMILAGSGIGE
jgi:hypothetical protein